MRLSQKFTRVTPTPRATHSRRTFLRAATAAGATVGGGVLIANRTNFGADSSAQLSTHRFGSPDILAEGSADMISSAGIVAGQLAALPSGEKYMTVAFPHGIAAGEHAEARLRFILSDGSARDITVHASAHSRDDIALAYTSDPITVPVEAVKVQLISGDRAFCHLVFMPDTAKFEEFVSAAIAGIAPYEPQLSPEEIDRLHELAYNGASTAEAIGMDPQIVQSVLTRLGLHNQGTRGTDNTATRPEPADTPSPTTPTTERSTSTTAATPIPTTTKAPAPTSSRTSVTPVTPTRQPATAPIITTQSATAPTSTTQPATTTEPKSGAHVIDGLHVISRTEWGANEALATWTPRFTRAQLITVHHTAWNTANITDYTAHMRSLYAFHAASMNGGQGWGDIGYHLLIDPNGRVYQGRSTGSSTQAVFQPGSLNGTPRSVTAGHVFNANDGNIGVCLMGDFSHSQPTDAAQQALTKVIRHLCRGLGLDPQGSVQYSNELAGIRISKPTVTGHRDWDDVSGATGCPGDLAYPLLQSVRANAR